MVEHATLEKVRFLLGSCCHMQASGYTSEPPKVLQSLGHRGIAMAMTDIGLDWESEPENFSVAGNLESKATTAAVDESEGGCK